jgi:hypothetical protein
MSNSRGKTETADGKNTAKTKLEKAQLKMWMITKKKLSLLKPAEK